MPAIHDFTADGFELLGVRVEYLGNRAALAIAYQNKNHPVTLFGIETGADTSISISGHCNGYNVLSWSDEQFAYFACSEINRDHLEVLEALVHINASHKYPQPMKHQLVIIDEIADLVTGVSDGPPHDAIKVRFTS